MKTRKTQVFGLLSLAAFVLLGSLLFFSDEALVKDDEADALSATQVQTHRDDQSKVRVNYDEAQKTLYVRTNSCETGYYKTTEFIYYSRWYDVEVTKQEFIDALAPYVDTQVDTIALYGIRITDSDVSSIFSSLHHVKSICQADPALINYYPDYWGSIIEDETSGNGLMINTNNISNLLQMEDPIDLVNVSGFYFDQKITQAEGAFKNLLNISSFTFNNVLDCTELVNGAFMFEDFSLNHGQMYEWIESLVTLPTYDSKKPVLKNTNSMFRYCRGFKHLEFSSGAVLPIGTDDAECMFLMATSENLSIGFSNDQMTPEKTKSMFLMFYYHTLTFYNETGGYTVPTSLSLHAPDDRIKSLAISSPDAPYSFVCKTLDDAESTFNLALALHPDVKTWTITAS